MLALIDVLRMGKAREKKIAIDELKKLFNESSERTQNIWNLKKKAKDNFELAAQLNEKLKNIN